MERVERLLKDAGFVLEKAYYAESHLPVLREIERTMLQLSFFRRRIAVLARKVGR